MSVSSSISGTLVSSPSMSSLPDSVPHQLPLPAPSPEAKLKTNVPLTKIQEAQLAELVAHFNAPDFALPESLDDLKKYRISTGKLKPAKTFGMLWSKSVDTTDVKLVGLQSYEKAYWSRQAFVRCLIASKWNYASALERAEDLVVWRREWNVDFIHPSSSDEQLKVEVPEDVLRQAESGSRMVLGYDNEQRPVLCIFPFRRRDPPGPEQIKLDVWFMERAIDLCPPGTSSILLLIDFNTAFEQPQISAMKKFRSASDSPKKSSSANLGMSMARIKQIVDVLGSYYGERLGGAVCVNCPPIFWGFWKLARPILDPTTREKIQFLEPHQIKNYVPTEQLQVQFGGDLSFEYDNEVYLGALAKLCEDRKNFIHNRWKEIGNGLCGVDEGELKGVPPAL